MSHQLPRRCMARLNAARCGTVMQIKTIPDTERLMRIYGLASDVILISEQQEYVCPACEATAPAKNFYRGDVIEAGIAVNLL